MESAIPESLTAVHLPGGLRKRLRTSKGPYAHQPETPRPFKVIKSFVNDASCPRLASAILMEIRDAWQHGKTTLSLRVEAADRPCVECEATLYRQNVT